MFQIKQNRYRPQVYEYKTNKSSSILSRQQNTHKIPSYFSIKSQIQKSVQKIRQKRNQTGHKSQRFVSPYNINPINYSNNNSNDLKDKIYRSRSDIKSKVITDYNIGVIEENFNSNQKKLNSYQKNIKNNSSHKSNQKSNELLIRIPKDQNMIENYIEELKKIKRQIVQERQNNHNHKQSNSKVNHQIQQIDTIYKFKQNTNNSNKKILKNYPYQQVNEKRLYAREMKKNKTKLKFVQECINQNQQQPSYQNQLYSNFPQKYNKKDQEKQPSQTYGLFDNKIRFICPQKLVIGDIISVKQQIKMQTPSQKQKKNISRYSTKSGRKLYSISQSTQLKKPNKIIKKYVQDNEVNSYRAGKISKFLPYSKSLILKRKNIDVPSINLDTYRDQMFKLNQQSTKKLKLLAQSSQAYRSHIHPFKSIQGFSTIQQKKQTLDILGQSCLNIKKNLIESNQKMDHILDLLRVETKQLKVNSKEKKKKQSYDRFSKVFPKGFFK